MQYRILLSFFFGNNDFWVENRNRIFKFKYAAHAEKTHPQKKKLK